MACFTNIAVDRLRMAYLTNGRQPGGEKGGMIFRGMAYLMHNGQADRSTYRRWPEGLQQDLHPLASSLRVQDGAAGAGGKQDCILVFSSDCTCWFFLVVFSFLSLCLFICLFEVFFILDLI